MVRRDPPSGGEPNQVFLNIPYDHGFENLYLAYIAGLTSFSLIPRATLEIPSSQRRLERILRLIEECDYSIHDMSRVQLDRTKPRTPRFNMPFELGLTVAQDAIRRRPRWYVCETLPHRISKSLSDLGGTDVRIHRGTVRGVFGVLCDMFVRREQQPSVQQMYRIYRILRRSLPTIMRHAGARDPYGARVFRDLVFAARAAHVRLSAGL